MYKECYSFIGEMLDKAAAGDKWGVLDAKEQAAMAAGENQDIQDEIEAVYNRAYTILEKKGVIKWRL